MRQQHARNRRDATNTHPSPLQLATQGNMTPPLSACRPAIDTMMPDKLRAWIGSTRAALQKKMARERAYLDRRAARGTSTPTDEALETDQLLQTDLLEMLDEARASHLAHGRLKGETHMNDDTMYTLVPSSNRGRYALDDPETGHDLTSGEPIAILLGGKWTPGHIEHSGHYSGPGCYHIADSGRKYSQRPDISKTQEEFEQAVKPRVRAAIQEGMSLADAMSAATGQVVDLFCGYYFIAGSDGAVCGLCTGMQVRLISARRNV